MKDFDKVDIEEFDNMEKEFNLSEKRFWVDYHGNSGARYYEKDVKEFIRLLKKEMPYEREFIDKLVGDKLT